MSIVLSTTLMARFNRISPSSLRVYVYLCSINTGQTFAAPASTIGRATHLQIRTVYQALRTLKREGLLHQEPGSVPHPNLYRIPIDIADEPEGCEDVPDLHANRPSIQAVQPQSEVVELPAAPSCDAAPPESEIAELAAQAFKPLTAGELDRLRKALPEKDLRTALEKLIYNQGTYSGGVEESLGFDFFERLLLDIVEGRT